MRLIKLAALAACVLFCSGPVNAQAFDWPLADPQEVDISPQMIAELTEAINQGRYGRLKSLLILRHGRLVHEAYFNGYRQNELMPLYSVTKSWGSALVGIAIRNGDLQDVGVPIEEVFTGYGHVFNSQPAKRQILVHDLLTMRHGLAWDEWSTYFTDPANPVYQMTRSADWWDYVLSRPATAPPDSVFRYSTGVANLLGGMIWSLTGQSALEYSEEFLFGPLGIEDYYVEVDLSDSPRGTGITDFQPGLTPTGHGLWLKARDLAMIGQLYLDRGAWQNRRVLASQWIESSWAGYSNFETDPQVFAENVSYGYQWWTYHFPGPGGEIAVHSAIGFADQYIFVMPDLDMVVVSTAANGSFEGQDMRHAIRDIVIPGVDADFDPVQDGGLTGAWYDPDLNHQGFMLEVVPSTGQVVLYWMTFEPGTGKQQWMIAIGMLHGRRAVLELLRPLGGDFVNGAAASELQSWGDAELIFQSCTRATVEFFSDLTGVEGTVNLQRLTPSTTCEDSLSRLRTRPAE
jgi:CubicO group peptidase (beta-lactamase class C family)